MNLAATLAKHVRDLHAGDNWTSTNLKDQLDGLTWQQATAKVHDLNTIAVLVYHVGYFVTAVTKVLRGGPLDAHDKYSFDCPPIESQEDWEQLVSRTLTNAETFAGLVEQLPDSQLSENFLDGKYGTWFQNLQGIIEHTHYHLGQIALLRKLVVDKKA
jgi:hypothetical protein